MSTASRSRRKQLVGLVGAAPLLVGGLSACGSGTGGINIAAIDVPPEKVTAASFTAQGKTADIKLQDGVWTPSTGATVEAATLLSTIQERVFPINAYRIMSGLNQADPVYGFGTANAAGADCGPGCAISVTDATGKTWKLTVGAPTFNKAGFYAKVDGDPRTFLITQQTVADIITEAIGKDFAFPESEKYKKVDAALNLENQDAKTEDLDPYLVQVLAAQQSADSVKAGQGPGDFLAKAASSTKSQAGAKDAKPVSTVNGPQAQAGPQ
jgi:hypothetical protein